jgi:flavin reductase (DIM6/NTAB) family NADH-FMN oxidoreductase RutF
MGIGAITWNSAQGKAKVCTVSWVCRVSRVNPKNSISSTNQANPLQQSPYEFKSDDKISLAEE